MSQQGETTMTITRIRAPKGLHDFTRNGRPVYSHTVITDAPKLVFISGQLSKDQDGNVVGKGDIRAQIRQVGENLKLALAAAGATMEDVVKSSTYVTDYELYSTAADLRDELLGAVLPTSTTVEVKRLSHPDLLIEIDVIAALAG
jgi:enamine deaminase RidA (YjgF/YER057c/UK114 family)